jgi:hypothetical protein
MHCSRAGSVIRLLGDFFVCSALDVFVNKSLGPPDVKQYRIFGRMRKKDLRNLYSSFSTNTGCAI